MSPFHKAASISEIEPGHGKTVTVAGKKIALFNVNGTFHAIDDTCPHRQGPLGEGSLNGAVVSCPWHGWTFEVKTGKCGVNPAVSVGVYPVKVENAFVFVQF